MLRSITAPKSQRKKILPSGDVKALFASRPLILDLVNGIFFSPRLGEQVAVFRAENGKAHVLDAYCPHLGANLAVGGRVLGDCLECPFHGWQFQGSDGKCVKVPYAEKGESLTGKLETAIISR